MKTMSEAASKVAHKRRLPLSEVKARFLKACGKTETLIQVTGSKVTSKCNACGTVRTTNINNCETHGCRLCSGSAKKTTKIHRKEVRDLYKDIRLESEYTGAFNSCKYKCLQCSYAWKALPTNMLKGGSVCKSCYPKQVKTYSYYSRKYRIRGYEGFALKHLLTRFSIEDVFVDLDGGVPKIKVGSKIHRPDIYVASKNLLVEVKSLWALGLSGYEDDETQKLLSSRFNIVKAKIAAARKQGYTYKVVAFSGDGKQLLPKNWEKLSRTELQDLLC